MENHLGLPSSLPIPCLLLEGSLHLERNGGEGHPPGPHGAPELLLWPHAIISGEGPGRSQPSPWTLGLPKLTEVALFSSNQRMLFLMQRAACREARSGVLSCFMGAWTLHGDVGAWAPGSPALIQSCPQGSGHNSLAL